MKIFLSISYVKESEPASIGMIDEAGRSFYAEILNARNNDITEEFTYLKTLDDEWCNDYYDNFVGVGYSYKISDWLNDWLSSYDSIEFVTDNVNIRDFIKMFDNVPSKVTPVSFDVNQLVANKLEVSVNDAFAMDRYVLSGYTSEYHTSLDKAKMTKFIYNRMINV